MEHLFSPVETQRQRAVEPLAQRMRPRTLEEFVGQSHFLAPGKLLRRMILADRLTSLLFYGPPGTGKTTLASLIARHTHAFFESLNATASSVKEVREVLASAQGRLSSTGQRTILFLDEIHRFNRAQQDSLLGDVEKGGILLIGATTENPCFAVNAPLVSRSQLFGFEPLSPADIRTLLERAISDPERGYGKRSIQVAPEALEHWTRISDGDGRKALMALEIAVLSQEAITGDPAAALSIDLEVAQESIQRKALVYDKSGQGHYDAASALIKSIRGSDPDAAVYWLACMLEAGEDPRFIARRVAISASEDIGNADPLGLLMAAAAIQVSEMVGLPECQLALSQVVTYLACCPKSNAATVAIGEARDDVRQERTVAVPKALRDAHYPGAATLGVEGYQYPHDFPGGFVVQEYLGVKKHYYRPTDRGREKVLREYLAKIDQMRLAAEEQTRKSSEPGQAPG